MSGKNIIFDDKKVKKSNFYKNKKLFSVYGIEVAIRPVCIKLPQMIRYVKHFDSNKTMSFKVNMIYC